MKRYSFSLISAMFLAAPLSARPTATLQVHGSPGSAIGARDYTFTSDDRSIQVSVIAAAYRPALPGLVDAIEFQFGGEPTQQVRLRFESGRGPLAGLPESWNHPLGIGFYERAMRAQAVDSPHPGVSLIFGGWAANRLSGRFVILAADFRYQNEAPVLESFAARFEIVSVTEPLSPVTGEFSYNFDPTINISLPQQSVTGPSHLTGRVHLADPAPADGVIELAANEPDVVVVPGDVPIVAGQQDVTFSVDVIETETERSVDVLSIYKRAGSVTTLQVAPKRPPISSVDVQGDPRAWIYSGHFHSKANASWFFSVDYLPRFVQMTYFDDVDFWDFYFLRNTTDPLTSGFYVSAPYGDPPNAPRLRLTEGSAVSFVGRGCSLNSGWFEIHDFKVDYSFDPPKLMSFWGTFEHSCEGNPPTTVRGTVMYNEPQQARARAAH
jgi:hypothetical protein